MAISAGTISKDRTYRSDAIKSLFEAGINVDTTAVNCKQGDLMCLDTTNHRLKVVAATGDALTFLGVSDVTLVNGVLAGPYDGLTTSQGAIIAFRGPMYGGVFLMILKTGDAFNPGDKVYLADATNSQTVSVTDPGDANFIGVYVGPAIASAAAGQEGQIKIGLRYPAATGTAIQY